MELDCVRSYAGLTVQEIEEGDSNNARLRANPCGGHLLATVRGRSDRAERRGRLGDHRLGAAAQDEVVIEVSLRAIRRDRGDDAVDAPLQGQAPSWGERDWTPQGDKMGDSRHASSPQARFVLERLDAQRSTP